MRRIIFSGATVAILALGSLGYASPSNGKGKGQNGKEHKENRGQCISQCAREAAQHRKECARNGDTDEAVDACMAEVKAHFKACHSNCKAGDGFEEE